MRQRVLFGTVRLAGMALAGTAGWRLGLGLAGDPSRAEQLRYVLLLSLAGGALGLLVAPYLTIVPLGRLWALARGADAPTLVGAGTGLLGGLLAAALAAFPVSLLPDPFGRWLPTGVAVLLAWLGVTIGALRKDEVARLLGAARRSGARSAAGAEVTALLDTSALIDGRIVAVRECGFLGERLVVPRFVLEELHTLADAADAARRQRGRRGLETLERLQRETELAVLDADVPDARGVDAKLIRLAQQRRAAVVTTDHNLSKVAALQRVAVLNVAALANALRAPLVPGDGLTLEVVQPGRERGQGIGYLEDGTMVVVEGGRPFVGAQTAVEVVRVLPTAGGRIVFSRPKDAEGAPAPASAPASAPVAKGEA